MASTIPTNLRSVTNEDLFALMNSATNNANTDRIQREMVARGLLDPSAFGLPEELDASKAPSNIPMRDPLSDNKKEEDEDEDEDGDEDGDEVEVEDDELSIEKLQKLLKNYESEKNPFGVYEVKLMLKERGVNIDPGPDPSDLPESVEKEEEEEEEEVEEEEEEEENKDKDEDDDNEDDDEEEVIYEEDANEDANEEEEEVEVEVENKDEDANEEEEGEGIPNDDEPFDWSTLSSNELRHFLGNDDIGDESKQEIRRILAEREPPAPVPVSPAAPAAPPAPVPVSPASPASPAAPVAPLSNDEPFNWSTLSSNELRFFLGNNDTNEESKQEIRRILEEREPPFVPPVEQPEPEPEPEQEEVEPEQEELEPEQEEVEPEPEPEQESEPEQEEQGKEEEKEGEYDALTKEELLHEWNHETNFTKRDRLLRVLTRKNIFPSKDITAWERQSGVYPDTSDPEFLQKLLLKREFAESLQSTWKPKSDPCTDNGAFEVTPVQRFVSNWMSPKTPYLSALLFHGVGVGKTCAAIQIAEAWLEQYPSQRVMIVCPPTIKQGFLRTIFDISKVVIGTEKEPNTASQCTGVTYMKLTNTLYERDPEKIMRQVTRAINRRYRILGYVALANSIRELTAHIPAALSDERREELAAQAIRKEFSHRLLMVDEAHNLRDVVDEGKGAEEYAGGKDEEDDAAGGKLLTPYLRSVLQLAEGMKFCALTATPMYNTYREIIFLLNLLLLNDKKATLMESDIFDREGNVTQAGKERLTHIAQHYVSFMRGENPLSFPVRLFPQDVPVLETYPGENPRGGAIPDAEQDFYRRLPLVPIQLQGEALRASELFTRALQPSAKGAGLSTMALAKLVQAGNMVFPETDATTGQTMDAYTKRTSAEALKTIFTKETIAGKARYRSVDQGAGWLAVGELANYSPKFDYLIQRIQQTEGCIFVYTRFIGGGALPLALALEANGYTLYGRKPTEGLLADGVQAPGGRQCAMCPRKEQEHAAAGGDHMFRPAYYGLLTGDTTISPRNDLTIRTQRGIENADGGQLKVIIGSQIASEGVDLRFVRETHVLDSWFHLNKTEQILGRAIRFLSHCALPSEKRNNTVYLYASYFPAESPLFNRETADLYSYRLGFKKAVMIGRVTRILKQSAIDCNLNRDAIVISGEPSVRQVDGQRRVREAVNINDMPFTAVCDWIETCDYTCSPALSIAEQKDRLDDSTYDEFAARWRMERIRSVVRQLFMAQPFYTTEDMWNMFSNVPRFVMTDLLREIVGNKTFQVVHGEQKGYIRYCNGYYFFQPNQYLDITIPLSIRVGRFPVKRDSYYPMEYDEPEVEDERSAVNTSGTVEGFWRSVVSWISVLSRTPRMVAYPEEVEQRRLLMSQGDKAELLRYEQILEMIQWFHRAFHQSNNKEEDRDAFRQTLLFHFWDEWLRVDEQVRLVYSVEWSQDASVMECIRENQARIGRLLIQRFYQPESDGAIYLCEEGTECQSSIIDAVRRDRSDRLNSFMIIPQTTGSIYGFLIAKNRELIFKTGVPDPSGEVGRGQECGNVSNKTGHINKLIAMGILLEQSGRGYMGLTRTVLLSDPEQALRGTVRICTLMSLFLRYFDAIHLMNKTWFFRPLFAHLTGHKGFSRRGQV